MTYRMLRSFYSKLLRLVQTLGDVNSPKMTCHTVVYAMQCMRVEYNVCTDKGKGKIFLPLRQCIIFTKHVHRNKNTLAETRRVTCTCGQTENIAQGKKGSDRLHRSKFHKSITHALAQ